MRKDWQKPMARKNYVIRQGTYWFTNFESVP